MSTNQTTMRAWPINNFAYEQAILAPESEIPMDAGHALELSGLQGKFETKYGRYHAVDEFAVQKTCPPGIGGMRAQASAVRG